VLNCLTLRLEITLVMAVSSARTFSTLPSTTLLTQPVLHERSMAEKSEPRQKSEYRCPYGNLHCGDNATYCEQCNKDYEKFLEMLGLEPR
jgi:hypothetical protein